MIASSTLYCKDYSIVIIKETREMFREKDYLAKRRDRAIATILSYKENHCDQYLPSDVSRELRGVVLAQMNDVVDLAFDLISDDIEINEIFLDRLDAILNGD